jgi:hypothetical protein
VLFCRHNDAEFKKLEDHLWVCAQDADVMIAHSTDGASGSSLTSCYLPHPDSAGVFVDVKMDLGDDEDGLGLDSGPSG